MEVNLQINHPIITFKEEQSSSSATQQQIINNLNFSIEDLLSKIQKVTNDYRPEPLKVVYSHSSLIDSQAQTSSTAEIQHQSLHRPHQIQSAKRHQHQHSDIQNRYQSHYNYFFDSPESDSKSESYQLREVDRNLDFRFDFSSKTECSERSRDVNLGGYRSLKLIDDSIPKFGRINSLFDDSLIKQVAQSRIMNQQGEGSCSKLQDNIADMRKSVLQWSESEPVQSMSELCLRDFQLGKQIGSGKFGDVYMCRHKVTGMVFALKKVFKSVIIENQMEGQFALQLKILYSLDHPNIVKLYAHFHDQYHVFLLLEYVEGGELMGKLNSSEKYVAPVIAQVIEAVDYIHSKGIVHRDIKPENIVIAFEHTAKLCDFGWAGRCDRTSMKTTFCGTLDYVAPQMKDRGTYSIEVDIWSIGVLTFQLLTGTAPFKEEIAHWRRRGARRSTQWDWHILYPPSLSGLAESFMRNLLRQNPDDRTSLCHARTHFFIRKYSARQLVPLSLQFLI